MTSPRTTVIACATVLEEMLPLMSPDMGHERLEFGLHLHPEKLREALQQAVDVASVQADTIILGYGLCSMAVVGLTATNCTLVVPRVDDCIAIFLGSRGAYQEQSRKAPGTYYLTKGWIEVGDTPFSEYHRIVEQYDKKRADRMMELMLANYTRLAFIETGQRDQERYREYTRSTAKQYNLRYEKITGSNALVKKILFGPWDDDFVVKPPGETISFADFETMATA
jgi:hypothetical protein